MEAGKVSALRFELQATLDGEVRFEDGDRALYATDGSNYRQIPIGVVIPKTRNDVINTVAICRKFDAPILPRGGGTSLAGQCCNVAVVIDMSKYLNQVSSLDVPGKKAVVEPGTILDDLRDAAEKHQLTFGPDPSTHDHCTLGGMIGNNSCGVHSVMAGKTSNNIIDLDILTYDGFQTKVGATSESELEQIILSGGRKGEIYLALKNLRDQYAPLIRDKYPKIPRRVSGYNLDALLPENGFHVAQALVGSEGTCVTVLSATTRLVYSPPVRSLLVLGYPDVFIAADHVPQIMKSKPIGLEGLDDFLIQDMIKKKLHPERIQILPQGKGWLLVEFGGKSKYESDALAKELMERLEKLPNRPEMKLFDDPALEKTIWKVRESGLGATARVPGSKDTWEGWEDSAVPPEHLGKYLRELRQLYNKFDYHGALYGHFGDGCVHTRVDFDLITKDGVRKFRAFLEKASDLVLKYGGSLSGEHGDGQSRAEFLPKMFGPELVEAFKKFKTIWDPQWKMNPGKVVNPYRVDENLRLGSHYNPKVLSTYFKFPTDDGSFPRATTRCVGVGTCRRLNSGTMCPSFKVTREEMHSTRGRARLLFEMLEGNPLTKSWHEKTVKESLDLCLSCKGCKGDCPVNVDMATYKAEFLSHYYKRRLRPRAAYAMGLIYWWARVASLFPKFVNLLTQNKFTSSILKSLGGISKKRQIPVFAHETFKSWFFRRPQRISTERPRVLLWADTFNNHFFTDTAKAAVEVLEHAGYQVIIPRQSLCCGRPLYDYGMLKTAKKLLTKVLAVLHPYIAEGVPLIGLEPSCLAVFRDELIGLFPDNEDAKRLHQQSFLLSEFLEKNAPHLELPKLNAKAVVHGHCHQKALVGMDTESAVLKRMGMDVQILDSGCCGMAGSFGFEKNHHDISIKVGELALLPAVRALPKDTFFISNGFSCREQVHQTTNHKTFHLAEMLQMAIQREKILKFPETLEIKQEVPKKKEIT